MAGPEQPHVLRKLVRNLSSMSSHTLDPLANAVVESLPPGVLPTTSRRWDTVVLAPHKENSPAPINPPPAAPSQGDVDTPAASRAGPGVTILALACDADAPTSFDSGPGSPDPTSSALQRPPLSCPSFYSPRRTGSLSPTSEECRAVSLFRDNTQQGDAPADRQVETTTRLQRSVTATYYSTPAAEEPSLRMGGGATGLASVTSAPMATREGTNGADGSKHAHRIRGKYWGCHRPRPGRGHHRGGARHGSSHGRGRPDSVEPERQEKQPWDEDKAVPNGGEQGVPTVHGEGGPITVSGEAGHAVTVPLAAKDLLDPVTIAAFRAPLPIMSAPVMPIHAVGCPLGMGGSAQAPPAGHPRLWYSLLNGRHATPAGITQPNALFVPPAGGMAGMNVIKVNDDVESGAQPSTGSNNPKATTTGHDVAITKPVDALTRRRRCLRMLFYGLLGVGLLVVAGTVTVLVVAL